MTGPEVAVGAVAGHDDRLWQGTEQCRYVSLRRGGVAGVECQDAEERRRK